jgi:hypothetical protein
MHFGGLTFCLYEICTNECVGQIVNNPIFRLICYLCIYVVLFNTLRKIELLHLIIFEYIY